MRTLYVHIVYILCIPNVQQNMMLLPHCKSFVNFLSTPDYYARPCPSMGETPRGSGSLVGGSSLPVRDVPAAPGKWELQTMSKHKLRPALERATP